MVGGIAASASTSRASRSTRQPSVSDQRPSSESSRRSLRQCSGPIHHIGRHARGSRVLQRGGEPVFILRCENAVLRRVRVCKVLLLAVVIVLSFRGAECNLQ